MATTVRQLASFEEMRSAVASDPDAIGYFVVSEVAEEGAHHRRR